MSVPCSPELLKHSTQQNSQFRIRISPLLSLCYRKEQIIIKSVLKSLSPQSQEDIDMPVTKFVKTTHFPIEDQLNFIMELKKKNLHDSHYEWLLYRQLSWNGSVMKVKADYLQLPSHKLSL